MKAPSLSKYGQVYRDRTILHITLDDVKKLRKEKPIRKTVQGKMYEIRVNGVPALYDGAVKRVKSNDLRKLLRRL